MYWVWQRKRSMQEAISAENKHYTTRRRQLWTNPILKLGYLYVQPRHHHDFPYESIARSCMYFILLFFIV
eukprot:COSAG05_NODE_214_length_13907_cov_28.992178_11_plen_70_part_00